MIRCHVDDVAAWEAAAESLSAKFGVPVSRSEFIRRAVNASIGRRSDP